MTTTPVDEGLTEAASSAMVALRRAEQSLRECVAAVHDAGVAGPTGYRSTSRLLQDVLRVDPGEAKRLLAHADALCEQTAFSGESLPARMPVTAAAAGEGAVGSAHIRVIARVMDRLGQVPGLDPTTLADAEQLLASQARVLAPAGLARVADRLVATLDPDGAAPDDDEDNDELHLGRRRGALALKALVSRGADAELIVEVLDALSTPAGPDDPRTLGRRRMEALLDLCAQALSPTGIATPDDHTDDHTDTDEAPEALEEPALRDADQHADTGPDAGASEAAAAGPGRGRGQGDRPARVLGRALLTLTIDHQWLREQIGHGTLDSDTPINPAEARRLACDAGIVPILLGTRGEPLDIGRRAYTVPDGMRRALHHRDRGCTFPGCTRRPRRCHAHHVKHWCDGGETGLENLTLLCRFHHHLIHHGDWTVQITDGRPWYTPPRYVDHQRRPRPGGPHPLSP